jgi:hypothetical protein
MRRAVSVLVATAAIVAATAAIAFAATTKYDSNVTISFQPGHQDVSDTFSGRVQSQKAACVKDRKVKVFEQAESGDVLVGTDLTDDSGAWKVPVDSAEPGTYYAKAKKKELSATSICKKARSVDLKVAH